MPLITNGLALALAVTYAALLIGSCIRLIALWRVRGESSGWVRERRSSLVDWWVLTVLFTCALIAGRIGLAVIFCLASLLALREFHQIFGRRSPVGPAPAITLGLFAVGHYVTLGYTQSTWILGLFPVLTLIAITTTQLLTGHKDDYLRTTAGYYWAAILMVFGLSHAVATTHLPPSSNVWNAGIVGWCMFLVVLTEVNDISQAIVGRMFEKRHSLAPEFSPRKSWEGFIGGILITTLLAALLAPWLTTFHEGRTTLVANLSALAAGAIISVCGLLGDLNMSGLKREAGIKDSSSLFPGMGGMIDRVDSLTLAAPAFYYYARWVTEV